MLAERYKLVEPIGRGGMGAVWRAQHLLLGTPVAIKLVHAQVAERAGMRARFLREAQAAAVLRSANVVQILDYGVHEGMPFIAMEHLDGEPLSRKLDRQKKLSTAETVGVVSGVARALSRAHKLGIVHRDLKPDNIFLTNEESGQVVKVLDFGIAKILDGPTTGHEDTTAGDESAEAKKNPSTETGAMLGTPGYMSPEQARGKKEIDGRSDLWSLAVITFECLTGERPFKAEVLGELVLQICAEPIVVPSSVAEVPDGFDAWFARATQREPNDRFQSVREMADALAAVLAPGQKWIDTTADGAGDDAPLAPSKEPAEPAHPTGAGAVLNSESGGGTRSKRWIAATVAIALALVAIAFAVRRPNEPNNARPAASSSAAIESTLVVSAPPPQKSADPPREPVKTSAEPVRVRLVVLPGDASVEVDGRAVRAIDGVVEIIGKLGSVHRVRLTKGTSSTEGDVSITETGALPAKIEIGKAAPILKIPSAKPSASAKPVDQPREKFE